MVAGAPFKASENDYDWLGRGIYFWEFGYDRAQSFAWGKHGSSKRPKAVGALIQLGRCFDLLDRNFTRALEAAFPSFEQAMRAKRWELPKNDGKTPDKKLRRLDCAVLNWYLAFSEKQGDRYDTVRGCFSEGNPVFEGSFIHQQAHIQLAVRNPECILGVFRPSTE